MQAVDFELYEGLLKMREYDDEVLEELDLVFTTDEVLPHAADAVTDCPLILF